MRLIQDESEMPSALAAACIRASSSPETRMLSRVSCLLLA